ncbi:MAG: hypothetical protein GIW94_03675 [Candidatus Eremiobacteraeota bacterium]|nr:hypothetical protein [Candidatus Eremiobacteraeota bacterium]MBC5821071.1 hypothetical protein [Candidatus Eremiobacteraeota bacterium]
MIDAALASALERIESRDADVRNAYRAGAFPLHDDVGRAAAPVASADPLSVAVPDAGYVLTQEKNGALAYSRDGAFGLVGGELQTADGAPVLGFALGSRTALAPLRVDPYDLALGRVAEAKIDADGTLAYRRSGVDPRSGRRRSERVIVGRIALARFPAGTHPVRLDATHVRPPAGIDVKLGVPADGTFGPLVPHARDIGRIDLMAGLAKMQEAYVQFEALRAAHHGQGETEKTAMDLLK